MRIDTQATSGCWTCSGVFLPALRSTRRPPTRTRFGHPTVRRSHSRDTGPVASPRSSLKAAQAAPRALSLAARSISIPSTGAPTARCCCTHTRHEQAPTIWICIRSLLVRPRRSRSSTAPVCRRKASSRPTGDGSPSRQPNPGSQRCISRPWIAPGHGCRCRPGAARSRAGVTMDGSCTTFRSPESSSPCR